MFSSIPIPHNHAVIAVVSLADLGHTQINSDDAIFTIGVTHQLNGSPNRRPAR